MGPFGTLRESVKAQGWPSYASCKGRVIFLLKVDATSYSASSNNLATRMGFPVYNLDDATANGDGNAVVFEQPNPMFRFEDQKAATGDGFLLITRADSAFVSPDITDPYDAATYFKVADSNHDNVASRDELYLLFGTGFDDMVDSMATPPNLMNEVDNAMFACAGANSDGVGPDGFDCVMRNLRSKLPPAEGMTAVKSRLSAAQESGAQVILTNLPAPPFKGAPGDRYWWVTMKAQCNPVTTCDCDMEEFIAMTRCTSTATHSATPTLLSSFSSSFMVMMMVTLLMTVTVVC